MNEGNKKCLFLKTGQHNTFIPGILENILKIFFNFFNFARNFRIM